MKTKRPGAALLALAAVLLPGMAQGQAQQTPIPENLSVAPQIELEGTGIATLEGHFPRFTLPGGIRSSTSRINVSDSALLLGISEQLFRKGGIGSFVIGSTTIESDKSPSGTDFFVHQLYLDYQTRALEGSIGRTDTGTRLIDFPTIRGDDLNEFVNVLNPFSNGNNIQEHRYTNQAACGLQKKLRYFVNLHAQNLITSTPGSTGQSGINSYGVNFQYQGAPTLQALQKVPLWGLGYERQSIGMGNGGAADLLYGGIVYNINADPIDRVDLRVQDIYAFSNGLKTFADVTDLFRAANNSAALSIRYLHSPFGEPGYQLALTAGFKSYSQVSKADTFALALTGVKRLGSGFDLVAQYTYQHREVAYAAVYSGVKEEHSIQVGFVFNFNNTFNQHLGPRRSLLNLQHQYVPE